MLPDAPDPAAVLAGLLQRPEWHQRAACRGTGVTSFVLSPRKGTWSEYDRGLCEDCPVRQDCLEVAMSDPLIQWLWGGTTGAERKAMRRTRVA